MVDLFVPGTYWTPERAAAAAERMVAAMNSSQTRALMSGIAAAAADSGDPAAAAADLTPVARVAASAAGGGPIERDACIVRRGRIEDVPALAELIIHGELPPMFIEEFVEGFCVVEHKGELIGCGGLELYGADRAVIRSVVVHERARGLGFGGVTGRLLVDDARAYGAKEIYLFTMHAVAFWEHLGFQHLELASWRPEVQVNWQFVFCSTFPQAVAGVYPMRMIV